MQFFRRAQPEAAEAAALSSGAVQLSSEKILVPALAKLQKDATGRYGNAQVKKAAEDTMAQLASLHGSADGAFVALQTAAASKTPKFMVTALDCMEKLLAHGFLGQTPEAATKVIKCISACSEQPDDAVQLQVVKALLTAVTSGVAHESNLLLALRACYHINLMTENAVNRTTSKVCLTQMMSWVFAEVEKHPGSHAGTPVPKPTPPPEENSTQKSESKVEPAKLPSKSIELPFGEGMYPSVQARLGFIETEQGSDAVAAAAAEVIEQLKGTEDNSALAGESLVVKPTQLPTPEEEEHHQASMLFATPAHKDAFLVLRTLSKLSMKAISFDDISATGEEGKADPRALKSKTLSLELLLAVLEQAGPQLKSADAILFAIKQYLVPALMKNCLETNVQVASIAMKVFEQVQHKFKDQLKKEIELVISNVLLGLLDSPHALMENRVLVLETLTRMCSSIQTMMEIFLNYDCDWNSTDLLRQITDTLAKVSLTRMTKDGEAEKVTEPEFSNSKKLRVMSSTALAGLIKALASYAKIEPGVDASQTTQSIPAKEEDNPQSSTQQATKLASAALDAFQLKQTYKRDLETAISKFNEKPKKGIEYLQERGHLENDPKAVAKFLLENQNALSKSMIGDFLGDNTETSKAVLYAYTEAVDFKGLQLDEAIRKFLSGFRIPGEAQKIDRVLEKFAAIYWAQNPDVFPSADTAFVLSFAIIMLQTDAHNPNIKPEKKMKKVDFFRNNRGIASGRNLSDEFLGGIYDRIVAKPITLSGDDVDFGEKESTSSVDYIDAKTKKKAFFKERAEILNEAEQKRKGGPSGSSKDDKGGDVEQQSYTFFMVEHSFATNEHVAPMFMVIWKSLCTAFSANLLNTDDPDVATLCLDGLYNAIRVAGRFHLDDERSALIDHLALLSKLFVPAEIEPKNVMCIQAITALAVTEGNYLGSSWMRVLQSVSELARLLMLSPTGEDDSIVEDIPNFDGGLHGKKRPMPPQPDPLSRTTHALKRVLNYTAVDRIFVRSVQLNEQAIVDFVDALTEVSRAELLLKVTNANGGSTTISGQPAIKKTSTSSVQPIAPLRPRLFSLQKIVEVADFNIDTRPRYTWGRVWEKLSEHFIVSGCHPSPQVAMYAVDSLKQLSIKFLDKEEFEGFAFQDRFLRPFEQIAKKAASPDVRALVLHCMMNFVVSKSKKIKSGWGAVFDVIAASAKDASKDNMNLGFSVLEMTPQYNAPPFLFAQGALKFAHANDATLSNKCIEHVEAYASSAYLPETPGGPADENAEDPIKARELLKGLASFATMDPRENVRRQALTSVFTILKQALEDRADAAIVSKIFMEDVLNPWTAVFTGDLPGVDPVVAMSTLVGGPRWPFSTLSYVVMEVTKFLSLALYENEISTECTPEEFSRKRTGGPEDEPSANISGKVGSHPRESAFLPLLESSLHLFEKLSGTPERSVSAVGVAAYNYCLDCLASHFSTKAWRLYLESLSQAVKNSSPAHLNSPEALKAFGLLGNAGGDDSDDETKIQSVSLDDLSKTADGVFMPIPPPKRQSPKARGGEVTSSDASETPALPPATLAGTPTKQEANTTVTILVDAPPKATIPVVQVPDLKASEVKFVTNLGLVKIVCRIIRRPFDKQEILSKACDIMEHAMFDASAFDDNHPLRIELSRRGLLKEGTERPPKEGIMHATAPPDAIEVEVLTAQTLLRYMQAQAVRDESRFERVLVGLVNRYLKQDRILAAEQTFKPKTTSVGLNLQPTTKSESEKELLALTPVVLFALRGMLEMDGAPVDRALPWVFPLLLQLIECPNRDVRAIVRRILEKHLTPRLSFRQ